MALDLDDMVGLAASLTLHVHCLRKEESPNIKRDALWHIPHD